jgi:lysozyme
MEPLNREVLRHELKTDEGYRLQAYKDSLGLLSIGTGRNLDRKNADGTVGITEAETKAFKITRASCIAKGITPAQCDALLNSDIDEVMRQLDAALPWWRTLDPVRQRVMGNLGFMGVGDANHGLLSFKNTLAHIKAHEWQQAAAGIMASKYADEVHSRANRLCKLLILGTGTYAA